MWVRARVFRVNKFSLIYRCSLLCIHYCLLNMMCLTPDPVLIFVTLSWPQFLCLSLTCTSDGMQVNLLESLSGKWYICLSRDSNPLSHDPEALSWTKHVNQTSSSGLYDENYQYNEHIPCVVVVICFGFNVAFNTFSVISRRCLVATGNSMLTEVSCPRHLTWYNTQSHYPDTASTSLSSSP